MPWPFRRTAKAPARKRPIVGRKYAAAQITRLTSDWVFSHLSANAEIKAGLKAIRDRSRELERNDDYARRYLSLVESNIVGKGGFSLRFDTDDADLAKQVRDGFAAWLNRADVSGVLDGVGIQRLLARTTARDGEAIARFLRGSQYPDGLGLQLLESDHLDHDFDDKARGWIMGVRVDDLGRPQEYRMFAQHPGDYYGAGGRVFDLPARDILHYFEPERAGQVRGVSWMTPCMVALNMLRGYQEAELVAARVSSCKMGFYKIPPGEDWTDDGKGAGEEALTDASPGVFERMPTGWEFQQFDPSHPTTQYGEFVKSILRDIASGLGVSYSALANDGSDANYSSMREMSIIDREGWMMRQRGFSRRVMARLLREWMTMAEIMGVIPADASQRLEGRDRWTGRTWPWVDPEKDINARKTQIGLALTSPQVLADEMGVDHSEMVKMVAAAEKERLAAGLPSLFASEKESAKPPIDTNPK